MSTSPSTSAPPVPGRPAHAPHAAETRGLALGALGVAIFALTLPMTRLAVGTPEAPLMSGLFIAMGRAAVAGLLSALLLLALIGRQRGPPRFERQARQTRALPPRPRRKRSTRTACSHRVCPRRA